MRRLVYASREPIIRSGAALTVTLGTRVADHIGGTARAHKLRYGDKAVPLRFMAIAVIKRVRSGWAPRSW
jgi:hypothetical protein